MRLPGPQGDFVGRKTEVVNDQLERRKAGVQQGLEMPVVLHPLGQGVADQDDPVSLFEHQLGFRGCVRRGSARGRHAQKQRNYCAYPQR